MSKTKAWLWCGWSKYVQKVVLWCIVMTTDWACNTIKDKYVKAIRGERGYLQLNVHDILLKEYIVQVWPNSIPLIEMIMPTGYY